MKNWSGEFGHINQLQVVLYGVFADFQLFPSDVANDTNSNSNQLITNSKEIFCVHLRQQDHQDGRTKRYTKTMRNKEV